MQNWDEQTDIWEHQGNALTVGELVSRLSDVQPDLPIMVAVVDGTGEAGITRPVEIGFTGQGDQPGAVVITVAQID